MSRIKICGITRLQDAQLAASLGAWAVGFIFVEKSQRYIQPELAFEISSNLPETTLKTGVFVNATISEVISHAQSAKLNMIQLHGEESPQSCKQLKQELNLPIIKAIRVQSPQDLAIINEYKNYIDFILLDSFSEKEHGGSGQVFDWDIAIKAKDYETPIILAGGINAQNIKTAITEVRPYALDLSSGVECTKGIKDHKLMQELFLAID